MAKMRTNRCRAGRYWIVVVFILAAGLLGMDYAPLRAAPLPQGETEVSPQATPEISQVKPNQGTPGSTVIVVIEGRNFSRGAYVSFSHPGVHVVSTRRAGPTQLETTLEITPKAPPGTLSLYVSNPASIAAEALFTVGGGQAPPAAEVKPSESATPEVAALDPPRVTQGSQASVKVTGRNFAQGAKVSFSNTGIRVTDTSVQSATELIAQIQVAPDASPGPGSLFVTNPDDHQAETLFEVVAKARGAPVAPPKKTSASEETASAALRFEVYNLGEGVSIIQNPNKPKGVLTLAGGKLKYEEAGREAFSAPAGEIKEVDANTLLGVNTGTFHIILNSGKTFNFVSATLNLSESQKIVEALRGGLR